MPLADLPSRGKGGSVLDGCRPAKIVRTYRVIVPSFMPGATEANLNPVLVEMGPDLPCKVDVYDPSGRLPRNQLSWASTSST
jgi:RES domain-containing protein